MMKRLIVGFVFVLVAAACGASDDGDADAPAPAATTTTVAEAEPAADTTVAHEDDDEAMHDDEEMHDDDEEMHDDEAMEGDEDVPADARVVEIVVREWEFVPETVQVAAGETVVFRISNEGQVEHEFRITNPHRIEEHIAEHAEGVHDETGGHHENPDFVTLLAPGAVDDVVVTFPEDTTIYTSLACLLPDHFEAGLEGSLEYTG